ncbi:MAG TPA: DNA polymerase ligase N-terminal domain-containing protein [Planctomicrobium sp.]|nr:DNA polymerase ligase N-terminal domain-containing protein [Planctomicrobium sp.]
MPRFVILTHDWPHLHWDFMLEQKNSLKTWRLDSEPILNYWITAKPLPDHRLQYLNYEGPVPQNRGVVTRFMEGDYTTSQVFPRETWLLLTGTFGKWETRIIEECNAVRVLFSQHV